MPASAKWYGLGIKGQYGSTSASRVDWANDTIKVALCTSTYTPNQDTHQYFSDVTNQISGTGYTAGGAALAGKTVNYDTASNVISLRASASSWTTATFTARYAVIYKDTGSSATSPLLGYVDFGGDETVSTGTFTITWDPNDGALKITAA
jgi:hypothetical protein